MTFCPPDPSSPFVAVPCPPPGAQAAHLATGLCLGDDTPIAVILEEETTPGAPPTVLGWTNLLTGAFTAGSPPAGSHPCGVDKLTELGAVLCDFQPDGSISGTALLEITYDDDGAVVSTRLIDPVTGNVYTPTGVLRPCEEPCVKCDTAVLCDNTQTPASEFVASTIKMLDTPNVAGNDGWNVTAFNTANAVNTPQVCPGVSGPPLPVPYPAFYNADWCTAWLAGCPGGTAAGGGCALNPGPALGLTSDFESINCGTGSGFSDSCSRYLVEKTFNTDASCTKIRVTSQRFRADGSAKVMIDGQDTGIFGAYNMTSPDGTIILTVAPGVHTMTIDLRDSEAPTWIQGGLTIECLAITPAQTTSVQFLRTTCRTCTGNIVSVTDTTLDGQTPYVPGPTVTICDPGAGNIPQPCANCESFVLADRFTNLTGQAGCISFLRRVCHNCDGTVSSVTDTLTDGTSPYSPTGNIGLGCDFPEDEEVLCDAGANYKPFLRTFIKDTTSLVVGKTDSDLDGSPYLVVGPVVSCNGSTETQLLCDGASSTSIVAVYHFDAGGILISTLYYGLDGSGPFAPAGPLYEGGCCAPIDIGPICYDNAGTPTPAVGQRRCHTDNPVAFDTFWYDAETGAFIGGTGSFTVVPCPVESFDFEEEILCDNNGSFFRRFTYTDGVLDPVPTDFTLAGAPYVPVGPVSVCPTGCENTIELIGRCDYTGTPGSLGFNSFFERLIWDCNGVLVSATTITPTGTPYVPTGTVKTGLCDPEITQEILCDSNGTQFLRRYSWTDRQVGVNNVPLVRFDDFAFDGVTAFVPVGAVGLCPVTTTVVTERDVEIVTLCDDNGGFLRRFVYDEATGLPVTVITTDFIGNPYVPVGTVKVCDQTVTVTEVDAEIQFMCDSNGPTTFLRRYLFNETTGAFTSFIDLTLAGAVYVPVGTVTAGACVAATPTELDVEFHLLCDSTGTTFLRAYRYNESTGAFTNFVDQNFDGTAFVPVGAVGECSGCCVVSQVCLSNGHPGVVLRFQDGTFHNFDTITGLAFVGTDIVPCTQGDQATQNESSTIARQTGAGAIAIPANRRSVTMVTISGNPTVSISGGAAVATAAGVTLTWSVDSRNQLLADTFTFTGVVGSDFFVITTF